MKGLAEELVLQMNLRRVWYNKISLLGILIWKRFQYGLVVGETGGKEVSWLCSSAAEEQEGSIYQKQQHLGSSEDTYIQILVSK